jgi:DNA-binding response OmpR family regulator
MINDIQASGVKTSSKILIIDDDPDIRTVMEILLRKSGYEVATASNREEALEKLEQTRPSMVLLDVLLSGSDGRDLCREIKDGETTKDIRVIMFSAHPGAADNIASYGADDFIPKPFNADALLERVRIGMGKNKSPE